MKIGRYRFSASGEAAGGHTCVLTMKSGTKPLCGLCGEISPHKLKRSVLLFNCVNYKYVYGDGCAGYYVATDPNVYAPLCFRIG